MTWIRAIARITVGGERGTGFLVSTDGLVLTAFHVVADLDQSKAPDQPAWRAGPISIRFGNPNNGDVWVPDNGTAERVEGGYSIDDDWALLRVGIPAGVQVRPLMLAQFTEPRAERTFTTFGFPVPEQDIGGEYSGTVGVWQDRLVQLTSPEIVAADKGGTRLGGISGAPCMVGGRVVGMVLKSLANVAGQAQKAVLFIRPIALAVRGREAAVDWDDGKPVVFQDLVVSNLPDSPVRLELAATALGLPGVREAPPIARRLLRNKLAVARDALRACGCEPRAAGPIIERVAAMTLAEPAVERIRRPASTSDQDQTRRIPLVLTERERIQRWFVYRAFHPIGIGKLVILERGSPIHAETVPETATEPALETAVNSLVKDIQKQLARRNEAELVADMLSSALPADEDSQRELQFWVILVGENRPDVIGELRKRLPNARVILGLAAVPEWPAQYRDLVEQVSPVPTPDEQKRLIRSWQSAASDLGVPLEVKEES